MRFKKKKLNTLKMIISLMCLGILLTSCGLKTIQPKVVTKIVEVKQDLPNELLTCKDVRLVPDVKTQADVAEYVLTLYDGYMDCFLKLEAIKRLQKEVNED